MPKKLLTALTVAAIVACSASSVVTANSAEPSAADISIQVPTRVVKGSSVRIAGTSTSSKVIIKVIAPNQSNVYFNVQGAENGAYQDLFTIPSGDAKWPTGTYTVAVGEGANIKTASFLVEEPTQGSGGGGSITPSADNSTKTMRDLPTLSSGTSYTDISAAIQVISGDNGVAQVTLDSKKAISDIKSAQAGAKTFVIMIPQAAHYKAVLVPIPADVRQAIKEKAGNQASIIVASQFGDYQLPMQALDGYIADTIAVTIAQVQDETMERLKDSAAREGLKLAGSPATFTVEAVDASGSRREIDSFGPIYVPRAIHAGAAIDFTQAVAVKANKDGSLIPAPTYFVPEQAGFSAVIHRTSNSTYAVVTGKKSFNDIQGHWAEASISRMASHLLVNGMADGEFVPQANMTRAQFTSLMVRALGISDNQGVSSFADVKAGDWFYQDVNIAVSAGLIEGYGEQFGPQDFITREQMAVIFERAVKFAGATVPDAKPKLTYADAASISPWAAASISKATQLGIMEGDDQGLVHPGDRATRAEGTVMLERMMKAVKFMND